MGTIATILLLIYWVYGCYIYLKIRPHWNETVAYTLRCRAERERLEMEEQMKPKDVMWESEEDDDAELDDELDLKDDERLLSSVEAR